MPPEHYVRLRVKNILIDFAREFMYMLIVIKALPSMKNSILWQRDRRNKFKETQIFDSVTKISFSILRFFIFNIFFKCLPRIIIMILNGTICNNYHIYITIRCFRHRLCSNWFSLAVFKFVTDLKKRRINGRVCRYVKEWRTLNIASASGSHTSVADGRLSQQGRRESTLRVTGEGREKRVSRLNNSSSH